MESQVDVLQGKRKALGRYRDAVAGYLDVLGSGAGAQGGGSGDAAAEGREPDGPASGRPGLVLAAQEDLRREIARAMHDGPAQSLTNIVLQAQIVERIVDRDPATARTEVRQLIDMVQRTLDATKSFIFEVRPMVLDDLGLVPTLRGAARDRGRRSGIAVAFDSFGADRRLPTDLESGLFRLLDDALAAYLALQPERVSLRLDWGDQLEVRIMASPSGATAPEEPAAEAPTAETAGSGEGTEPAPAVPAKGSSSGRGRAPAELPPALAQMIAQRQDDEAAARAKARRAREIVLPPTDWEGLRTRAESLGLRAELLAGGSAVQVTVDLGALAATGPAR
jgi:hypothetical protein